jgi:hypothetical protein
MNGINLFKSCGLVKKVLEDRICADYKKALDLLGK